MEEEKYVIILFNGFGSSKLWWEYDVTPKSDSKLRSLDFLDKLKEIGDVFTFNQICFNIGYYMPDGDKKENKVFDIYRKHGAWASNLDFILEDLDNKNICDNVYDAVKKKFGKYRKYIIIGHSYGVDLALLFSKLYSDECFLCCSIDGNHNIFDELKRTHDKWNSGYKHDKYTNNNKLEKSLNIIVNSNDDDKKHDEIIDLLNFIKYKTCEYAIKYYDKTLYVPTIIFRMYITDPRGAIFNEISKAEHEMYKTDKNLKEYVYMKGASHYIWKDQEHSNKIIETIKNVLSKLSN